MAPSGCAVGELGRRDAAGEPVEEQHGSTL